MPSVADIKLQELAIAQRERALQERQALLAHHEERLRLRTEKLKADEQLLAMREADVRRRLIRLATEDLAQ